MAPGGFYTPELHGGGGVMGGSWPSISTFNQGSPTVFYSQQVAALGLRGPL